MTQELQEIINEGLSLKLAFDALYTPSNYYMLIHKFITDFNHYFKGYFICFDDKKAVFMLSYYSITSANTVPIKHVKYLSIDELINTITMLEVQND